MNLDFQLVLEKIINQCLFLLLFLHTLEKILKRVSLNAISKTPLPNWSISYSGLMNFDFIKERFKRFSLGHAYRSSYTLNNFKSNLEYDSANTHSNRRFRKLSLMSFYTQM